jgi:hypothetical protein
MLDIGEYILLTGIGLAFLSICYASKIIFCDDRKDYKPISSIYNDN